MRLRTLLFSLFIKMSLNKLLSGTFKQNNFIYLMYQNQQNLTDNVKLITNNNSTQNLDFTTIRVVAHEMSPYVKIFNGSNAITGYVGELWRALEESLKFKSRLTETTYASGIAMLLNNNADVMLTAGIATKQHPSLEYSQPYFYNWFQLYMRLPNRIPNSTFYIRTLSPTLWHCCVATFIILTIALHLTIRVLNHIYFLVHKRNFEPCLSVPSCFLIVLSGFLNQGFAAQIQSCSCRIQIIVALLFGFTIYTAMSAALVSKLAVYEMQIPIKSLDDVINNAKWSLCVRKNSFVYDILSNDSRFSPKLNTKACERDNGITPTSNQVCKPYTVILESRTVMSDYYASNQIKCETVTDTVRYYYRGNSIIFNRNFKHKKLIDLHIEKLRGRGILQKLHYEWIRSRQNHDINTPFTIEVTLYHIKEILVLYSIAILLSVIVLFAECIVSKCSKPQLNYTT